MRLTDEEERMLSGQEGRAYQRAMAEGAVSEEKPRDTPYGDRRAMVRDPSGNVFQIARVQP